MQRAWTSVLFVLACIVMFTVCVQQPKEYPVVSETMIELSWQDFPIYSSHSTPKILQFSCAVMIDPYEFELAQHLWDSDESLQLVAAKKLWQSHCRIHAESVLKFIENSKSQSPAFRDFRRAVEVSLQTESIIIELKEGDYKWGAWLAYLRPHESLVPVLLEILKNDQQKAELAATLIALGKSNDRRAIQPLIQILESDNGHDSWAAATAIGLFEVEVPGLEDHLLKCLQSDGGLTAAKVCNLLGKIGTEKSLPRLKELAAIKHQGAVDVDGVAQDAIEKINLRILGKPDLAP